MLTWRFARAHIQVSSVTRVVLLLRRGWLPRGTPGAARGLEPLVEEVAGDGLARRPRDHAPQQVVLGGANRVALVLILLVLLKIKSMKRFSSLSFTSHCSPFSDLFILYQGS